VARAATARRPNVILILTDDQGYGDLACHGNPVLRTPHLDRLHAESVRFTNFHADPLCSPTRSALMTGRYSCRTGVWATVLGRSLLRRDETTMADVFQSAGFRTGIVGKWHLGDNYPFRPQDRGFQDVLVHGGGGVGQTPDFWGNRYFDDTYFRHGKPEKFTGYCTDVWFDNAVRFIEANRARPFFLYLATNAPHAPFEVADSYRRPYLEAGLTRQRASFYGMIANIDENVGRLRRKLAELGLAENTLIVFMTDNGSGGGAPYGPGGFSAGMRAAKASAYEGGHRVPCFLHWPAGGFKQGRDFPVLAGHFDLLPTLTELTGLKRAGGQPLDGRSLAPALRGGRLADRTLVVQVQQRDVPRRWNNSAVMTEQWRYVNGQELYDITADPAQSADVAARNPEVSARLRNAYENWWTDVSARFGEYNEIVIGSERENPCRLTAHDWHVPAPAAVPWNQNVVRKGLEANGFWAVEVERAGRYEITLRQQPAEADSPVAATRARLKIGGIEQSKAIAPRAAWVSFDVELKPGKTRLETEFSGGAYSFGAFFVYIRRQTRL
jgi:arylsulfatase A-like enzyme